ARGIQPAARSLPAAQGGARAAARQGHHRQANCRRGAAQAQRQGADGRPARSAPAREARARGRGGRPQIRRQARRGGAELPATGNLDAKTVKELNGPPRDKSIDLVIANMERWRWYPRDLGKAHVVVNLPDFTLKVMHDGAQVWTTRIVIGKTDMPTPLLSET